MITRNIVFLSALWAGLATAQQSKESDYYKVTTFEIPKGEVVEATGFAVMDDGKVAVSSRRGQIWTIDNADQYPDKPAKWNLFAEYLHEPLGITFLDGWLYATQRPEVTRMCQMTGGSVEIIMNSRSVPVSIRTATSGRFIASPAPTPARRSTVGGSSR